MVDDNEVGWLGVNELIKKLPLSQRLLDVSFGLSSNNQLTNRTVYRLKSVIGGHRVSLIWA